MPDFKAGKQPTVSFCWVVQQRCGIGQQTFGLHGSAQVGQQFGTLRGIESDELRLF